MAEYLGMEKLKRRLELKRVRVNMRYEFYEMKNVVADMQISTPPALRYWQSVLGWCGKAVDSLSDRLQFHEFANDNFLLGEIFQMNNPDTLFDSAILSALIGACSFVYITAGDDGFPVLQVIDGADATGVVDQPTGLLVEGYAVLERDEHKLPLREVYLTAERTDYYEKGAFVRSYDNVAPAPLLVPIIFRPDARRPLGHSRISRACMDIMSGAIRTIKRSEISAEFFSFPQKYVIGLDPDTDPFVNNVAEKWAASMSSMLSLSNDEDGNKPTLGQFSQQSMEPHVAQLRMFASLFAGETGLTLDDLGFATENPSSAEAIKAAHENLRLTARKAQRTFGTGFLNVGYLAACLRDRFPYLRRQFYLTTPVWDPIFEPDVSALGMVGDAVMKINQAVPGYLGTDNIRQLTGIETSGVPVEVQGGAV